MLISKGDLVRPNNIDLGLPRFSVWRVIGTAGGLRLHPHNDRALDVSDRVAGLRYKPEDFIRQTLNAVGEWVDELPMPAAEQASWDSAHLARLLKDARKQEAERRQELRKAQAAKAKADKEAAAAAKVEEARKALSARLHADRSLALATLALIGEVTCLNNGCAERPAPEGIANHADQLQPLARSYGYRIVKPSMVALVVKL